LLKFEIELEDLQKAHVMVATPMYGGMCHGIFAKSIVDLGIFTASRRIPVKFYYMFNESLITRARNYCVDEFMRSECTHLMFIDSDIGFRAQDITVLLAMCLKFPEKFDVLCGPYPKKNIAWEKVKQAVENGMGENAYDLSKYVGDYVFNPTEDTTSFRLDEPVEVLESGTGFMMIPRTTFEKWDTKYPELRYTPDHIRTSNFDGQRDIGMYFQAEVDPKSNRYLSEDYWFCQKVRDAGMHVWMCPWMELKHAGSFIFGGSLRDLAEIGVGPTADQKSSVNYQKNNKTAPKPENPELNRKQRRAVKTK